MTDLEDRLVGMMLEEKAGGDIPPDLRDRIMHQLRRRSRKLIILKIIAATAAIALLILFVYQKPEKQIQIKPPVMTEKYRVVGEYKLIEKQIVTGDRSALLFMGHDEYIKVMIGPHSKVQVEDGRILLRRGFVDCEIEKNCGGFEVDTDVGVAEVLGTRFIVHVLDKENRMFGKRMMVKVLTGAVMVSAMIGDMSSSACAGEVVVVNNQGLVAAAKTDEKAQTPAEIELKAISSLKKTFEAKATSIREEILQDTEVATLLTTATNSTNTYFAKLETNETYKQLQNEKKEIADQSRAIDWGKMDKEERKNAYREMGHSWRRRREINKELASLGETDEELKPLRKAMQKAWVTYQKSLENKLNQNKEYVALQAKIIEVSKWQKNLMTGRYLQYSKHQRGGGIRGMQMKMGKPKATAPIQKAKETETF